MAAALPSSYKAVVAEGPGISLKFIDVELEQPEAGQVLVRVLTCGVCHSDVALQQDYLGSHLLPRVPGHEIVGDVVAVGDGVTKFDVGDRVGGTWHGGKINPSYDFT